MIVVQELSLGVIVVKPIVLPRTILEIFNITLLFVFELLLVLLLGPVGDA